LFGCCLLSHTHGHHYPQVRKHYKGNHLLPNVPKFPKKQIKLMTDHLSEEFINERKDQLNSYLQG